MTADVIFWAVYFAVPVIGFGALCVVDYRRQGAAAFRWVEEPALVICLLALAAWPLFLPVFAWEGTEGWRNERNSRIPCANCPHSKRQHPGTGWRGGARCFASGMDRSIPDCGCRKFRRAKATP